MPALAALMGVSALTCHMQSLGVRTVRTVAQQARTAPFKVSSNRPSQFKPGLFYGFFLPTLLIPSFRNDCFGKAKYDKDFSFAKGFGVGVAVSALTLSAGCYAAYKCFRS